MSAASSNLSHRARVLLRREGPAGLAAGVLRHLRFQVRHLAYCCDYYIYRYPIPVVDPEMYRPRLGQVEVVVIETLAALNALVSAGREDPRDLVPLAEKRLSAGAVAVCAYAGSKLAYMGWVSTSEAAKLSFDCLPYRVAFDAGEAATGGAWTAPEYRGAGLYRYMFGHELALLRQRGRTVCCNAISIGNHASQRGQSCYGARVCARARLLRVLHWRRWTETPMSGPCPSLALPESGDVRVASQAGDVLPERSSLGVRFDAKR